MPRRGGTNREDGEDGQPDSESSQSHSYEKVIRCLRHRDAFMTMLLLDAAFRLVSHSLSAGGGVRWPSATDAARKTELRRLFVAGDFGVALDAAHRLEKFAIELAEAHRGQSGEALSPRSLADRCPGFSRQSYEWAINDGLVLTRK